MSAKLFIGASDLIDEKTIVGGGIIYILIWVLVLLLSVAGPLMFWAMHRNLKSLTVMIRHQGKVMEAMNANLISISQQINHFGTGQPMPRVHAPVPSARGGAPKNGLRR